MMRMPAIACGIDQARTESRAANWRGICEVYHRRGQFVEKHPSHHMRTRPLKHCRRALDKRNEQFNGQFLPQLSLLLSTVEQMMSASVGDRGQSAPPAQHPPIPFPQPMQPINMVIL